VGPNALKSKALLEGISAWVLFTEHNRKKNRLSARFQVQNDELLVEDFPTGIACPT
jgi:hypothetical protein